MTFSHEDSGAKSRVHSWRELDAVIGALLPRLCLSGIFFVDFLAPPPAAAAGPAGPSKTQQKLIQKKSPALDRSNHSTFRTSMAAAGGIARTRLQVPHSDQT
jgi:hypothetical protein